MESGDIGRFLNAHGNFFYFFILVIFWGDRLIIWWILGALPFWIFAYTKYLYVLMQRHKSKLLSVLNYEIHIGLSFVIYFNISILIDCIFGLQVIVGLDCLDKQLLIYNDGTNLSCLFLSLLTILIVNLNNINSQQRLLAGSLYIFHVV